MDEYNNNCLLIACNYNSNININSKNNVGNNCLLLVCCNKLGSDIIKYLIEEYKMNVNVKGFHNHSCLLYDVFIFKILT